MNAGLIILRIASPAPCVSRARVQVPRDAMRRMSATKLVLRSSAAAATPSQQKLRRSYSVYCELVVESYLIYT